jgi:hypothetical protein
VHDDSGWLCSSIEPDGSFAYIGTIEAQRKSLSWILRFGVEFAAIKQHYSLGAADPKVTALIFKDGEDAVTDEAIGGRVVSQLFIAKAVESVISGSKPEAAI